MSSSPVIVGLSGSVVQPSRTTALLQHILSELADEGRVHLIELAEEAPHLFSALTRSKLAGRAKAVIEAVEQADLLVVGTQVYRASYTGALKHLFDLVDHRAFPGKPVLLAATGGTALHGLVTEHQMRPLFGFLNALTLPTAVYAVESDFDNYILTSAKVRHRAARAVEEARLELARCRPSRTSLSLVANA